MVERQLRGRGIRDDAVLRAMQAVPRELFVAAGAEPAAYADEALSIQAGQTISQPYMVARMTELIEPYPGMHVLEVGTGSGYQAAVLATIGCEVTSVERHEELAETARARLAGLGLADRVSIFLGDGSVGWPVRAPYAGIVVTAAAPRVPQALRDQLADGGRLVIPVGSRIQQDLLLVVRRGGQLTESAEGPCIFVPLVGEQGFADEKGSFWDRWL